MRAHGRLQLRAAVAPRRMEDVAGQAGRVHPREHVFAVADVAADERDVRLPVGRVLVDVDVELAVLGRQLRRRDTADTLAQSRTTRVQRISQTCADLMQHSRNSYRRKRMAEAVKPGRRRLAHGARRLAAALVGAQRVAHVQERLADAGDPLARRAFGRAGRLRAGAGARASAASDRSRGARSRGSARCGSCWSSAATRTSRRPRSTAATSTCTGTCATCRPSPPCWPASRRGGSSCSSSPRRSSIPFVLYTRAPVGARHA